MTQSSIASGEPATKPLIRLLEISKVFRGRGTETRALDNVHLEIFKGEYLSVAGPSGCGKSTLLSILGLLDVPSAGIYQLEGQLVEGLARDEYARLRNRGFGFVFQNFNLIGDLTVLENVALPLSYAGVKRKQRRERVMTVLDRVGMSERAAHYPNQLSGGQQQRVAVARALVNEPEILLADEPTGNLDSHHGEEIMALLNKLHAEGATICLVTHDPRYMACAYRRVEMLDGRIVDDVGGAA